MQRDISSKLVDWKEGASRKPLILRGARQVGKTWVLEEFGKNYFSAYHYLNFEEDDQLQAIFALDLKPDRILQELEFYFDRQIDVTRDLLIFDEIQACPRALNSLKYFQEQVPQLALAAAGSLLGVELGKTSFPVGKVEFMDMFPLCFYEFLRAVGDDSAADYVQNITVDDTIPEIVHKRLWQQLKNYMIVGGLPEVVVVWRESQGRSLAAFNAVRKVQKDLLVAYLADMAKHSGSQNSMHLERLWVNIPNQLAREQDGSAPKFQFKNVIPGIRGYERLAGGIDWLSKAGLINRVQMVNNASLPLSAYTKENTFKLYCFDTGLLGALGDIPPQTILAYEYGSYKGYVAENFVAQQFRSSNNQQCFYWREGTAEIEFLRLIDGEIVPVEVKAGWVTQAKSLKVFVQKYAPTRQVVLSGKPFAVNRKTGVHSYPLYLAGKVLL
ncbi:MAG: AAA family ATPase [Thermodesulfobacteriota bacterium]|nr:AAA family ATPase [Thermodesulfobacteriota bacterium]